MCGAQFRTGDINGIVGKQRWCQMNLYYTIGKVRRIIFFINLGRPLYNTKTCRTCMLQFSKSGSSRRARLRLLQYPHIACSAATRALFQKPEVTDQGQASHCLVEHTQCPQVSTTTWWSTKVNTGKTAGASQLRILHALARAQNTLWTHPRHGLPGR